VTHKAGVGPPACFPGTTVLHWRSRHPQAIFGIGTPQIGAENFSDRPKKARRLALDLGADASEDDHYSTTSHPKMNLHSKSRGS
jgi:hypothetical protein